MPDDLTPRPEVMKFASLMEKKLQINDYKGGWKGGRRDLSWFFKRMSLEVIELDEALEKGIAEDIALEAADIANFCMMIADIVSEEKRK
jgi:NTP pyrophosphatase (non-canonical NTP hydrolase)